MSLTICVFKSFPKEDNIGVRFPEKAIQRTSKKRTRSVMYRIRHGDCSIQYFLNITAQIHPIILNFLLKDAV